MSVSYVLNIHWSTFNGELRKKCKVKISLIKWQGNHDITEKTVKWEEHGAKQQVLTRKGAASQSAQPPSSSPGWSPHSRCCSGGAPWSTKSWHGCCCGSRGGAAGARLPQSPWKIPVWPDQQRSYQLSIRHWSWWRRKNDTNYLRATSLEMIHHFIIFLRVHFPGNCLAEILNTMKFCFAWVILHITFK